MNEMTFNEAFASRARRNLPPEPKEGTAKVRSPTLVKREKVPSMRIAVKATRKRLCPSNDPFFLR